MFGPRTEIRSATTGEIAHAVAAIVAAFLTDPLARFAWPSPHDYLRAMPLSTREFVGGSFEHGTVYVSADFCGTAIWFPPGVHPNGEALERGFPRHGAARSPGRPPGHLREDGAVAPRGTSLVSTNDRRRSKRSGEGSRSGADASRRRPMRPTESPTSSRRTRGTSRSTCVNGFEVMGEFRVGAGSLVTPMLRRPR